jgi:hypothetical protein
LLSEVALLNLPFAPLGAGLRMKTTASASRPAAARAVAAGTSGFHSQRGPMILRHINTNVIARRQLRRKGKARVCIQGIPAGDARRQREYCGGCRVQGLCGPHNQPPTPRTVQGPGNFRGLCYATILPPSTVPLNVRPPMRDWPKRRSRHPRPAGLAGAQEHPAHFALLRAGTGSI